MALPSPILTPAQHHEMLGPADLVISAGHAPQVRCSQAEVGTGDIETLGLCENSLWRYSERKRAETHVTAFQSEKAGNSIIPQDESTALRQKIATRWENTTGPLHRCEEMWLNNPSAFFGADTLNSSEQWSYQSLRNSISNLSSYQAVFHKINLASCYDERIKQVKTHSPNFNMRNIRRSTLSSLHPGYEKLGDQERNTICKNFAADVFNGKVLRSLSERSWGLLLTIGPILSDRNLAFLSKTSTSWLCTEKLVASKRFAKLALILLSYLEHKFTTFGYDPPVSPTPTFVLPLLYAMGGCVPTCLFEGISIPRRMDDQGTWYEVPLSKSGLGQGIIKHLDADVLRGNLDSLISVSIITVQDSNYVYNDQPAWISSEQFRCYWINQAFRFCCYVFPRGPILDSSFGSTEKKLLHILCHILEMYTTIGQDPPYCEDTVETLLAASRLAKPDAKEYLLAIATESEKRIRRVSLQADITFEWSVVLRSKGQVLESEQVIQDFLQRQDLSPESLRISLQRLRISHAYNRIYKFDFCTAHESLEWGPLRDSLSDRESVLLCDQLCCTGRILRGQGQFEEASRCFKICLTAAGLPSSKRHLIISHLSDLYCELDYNQRSNPVQEHLKKGKEIVSGELDRVAKAKQHSKGFRRLQLSLIEILVRQNHLTDAESLIKRILGMYGKLSRPDVNDKVGHVRALIAWARISEGCDAERRWMDALHQNRLYNPGEEDVFTCGVIYLFVAWAQFQQKKAEESRHSFNRALEVLSHKSRQFLIPGQTELAGDSHALDSLRKCTPSLGLPYAATMGSNQGQISSTSPTLRTVTFDEEPTVRFFDQRSQHDIDMSKLLFETFEGCEVTDSMLLDAAKLFNENYGVWGTDAARVGAKPVPTGTRVKLSVTRLRNQYLLNDAVCSYVKVTVQDRLAGNAFACRWTYNGKVVCWITQLVVHSDFRERGIAASLLNHIRHQDDEIYGIMSSHPAACLAAAKIFGNGIGTAHLNFARQHARAVMDASPIGYIKDAKLRGSLFDAGDNSGAVSSVYTEFFVDHSEPLKALEWVREGLDWPLGELLDGFEFLLLLEVRRRGRSRSRSNTPGKNL